MTDLKPWALRGVLFDLDETLIDSQSGAAAGNRAVSEQLSRILKMRGFHIGPSTLSKRMDEIDNENLKRVGRFLPKDKIISRVLEENAPGLSLPAEEERKLVRAFWNEFALNSPPYSDTVPTLEHLRRRGYAMGLVSDTDGVPGIKHWRIGLLSFKSFFKVTVVAGEDVPYLKPNIQPYLTAISELGTTPSACVFVGDRPCTDILGAKDAGLRTVLVRRRSWDNEEGPDMIVENLSELCSFL